MKKTNWKSINQKDIKNFTKNFNSLYPRPGCSQGTFGNFADTLITSIEGLQGEEHNIYDSYHICITYLSKIGIDNFGKTSIKNHISSSIMQSILKDYKKYHHEKKV